MKQPKATNHNLVQIDSEGDLHPGIETIALSELKTKAQSKAIAEPVIIGNFEVKYYPGRHEEYTIIHINDDSFAGGVSCTDIIELAETLIDFGVKIIRDDLPGSPIEPTPTIQDTKGKTYTCEDIEELQELCERTDTTFSFAEVSRAYQELTGKEIETLTFEESRQAEIDDVEKNVPYVMIGGLQAVNEERVEASKAEIMENFDMEAAHRREGNLCKSVIYCENCDLNKNFIYVYNGTWYRLDGSAGKSGN